MTTSAPRIEQKLLQAIVRFDDRTIPIAEVNRRVGTEADRLGHTRPSYERVRELVHLVRRLRRPRRGPSVVTILLAAGAGYAAGWASTRRGGSPGSNSLLQEKEGQASVRPGRKQRVRWTVARSVARILRSSRS